MSIELQYILPVWAYEAMINEDYTGITEDEHFDLVWFDYMLIRGVEEKSLKLGLSYSHYTLSIADAQPSYYEKNDINNDGEDCYPVTITLFFKQS